MHRCPPPTPPCCHALAQVAFVLPTSFPVTSVTLNYAGVAVAIVLLGAVSMWVLPVIGARHWYRGELKTYVPEPVPVRACAAFQHAVCCLLTGCMMSACALLLPCASHEMLARKLQKLSAVHARPSVQEARLPAWCTAVGAALAHAAAELAVVWLPPCWLWWQGEAQGLMAACRLLRRRDLGGRQPSGGASQRRMATAGPEPRLSARAAAQAPGACLGLRS